MKYAVQKIKHAYRLNIYMCISVNVVCVCVCVCVDMEDLVFLRFWHFFIFVVSNFYLVSMYRPLYRCMYTHIQLIFCLIQVLSV
jgi:hypothetical protein